MHQAPEVTLQAVTTAAQKVVEPPKPVPPPQPQVDISELQMQLIALQQQVSQLQSSQQKPVAPMKINILQPTPSPHTGGLQLPQNEVVLLSMNRSPCPSPRGSPCPSPRK